MRKPPPAKLTQTEKAYHAIKQAILQGDVDEGVFLSETDIAARYEIGRTPFREACNRLHHEGLLQVVPRRGYYIPEISFHAVSDLFEVRIILEDAIAQLAAVRATGEEIEQLQKLSAQSLPSGRTLNEFRCFVQANTRFHLLLARATRNRSLVEMLRQNLESTERLMYYELRSRRFGESEFRMLHQRIVDALRRRDPAAVRQAVWEDISEAQGSTLAFRGAAPTREPLIGGLHPRPQIEPAHGPPRAPRTPRKRRTKPR